MFLFLFWMSLQETVGFNILWSLSYNQQKHQASTVRNSDDISRDKQELLARHRAEAFFKYRRGHLKAAQADASLIH